MPGKPPTSIGPVDHAGHLDNVLVGLLAVGAIWAAVCYVAVWFPYGFVVGDLAMNPMLWGQGRRAAVLVLWFLPMCLVLISAAN